ncbi:MAG: efflux RND transporter periplasmic adaptor subunit [Planctomycetota bacterium]|jgi:Cu(I)/Ag(I) efflux system membrane fusion protein
MTKHERDENVDRLRGVLVRWAFLISMLGVFALWTTCRMTRVAGSLSSMSVPPAAQPDQAMTHAGHQPSESHDAPRAAPLYRCTMPECGDQGSTDPDSRCPVCGMKRGLVDSGLAQGGDLDISLGDRARRLAEVQTEPAARRLLFKRIRTLGRVGYDETRYKMVSAWIDGRIDKLFADFTGMTVSRGDHLVEIYSPALLSAQEEFLQAVRSSSAAASLPGELSRRSSEQVLVSARRKLELLGITQEQIAGIEASGETQTHLVVYAPIGGTIVEKRAMEGMYFKTGDTLYTIADLSHLWVLVDLYESDLPWVKPFQSVNVTTRSLPGEVFNGEIVFVDPRVDPATRTVALRIHINNRAMRLKPDMWVTATIDAALAQNGRGAVPAPGGAFACPMHPWQTSNISGECAVCEMNLIPVEDLPQYAQPTEPVPLLSVPRQAVMQTGKRSLVYVEVQPGTYRGVEITPGPLATDADGREFYPILEGLDEGDLVVTRGNFAIDSQMQLAGKPSLFPVGGMGGHDHGHHGDDAGSVGSVDAAQVQTICPVMGNEIDKEVFTDYLGVRVYFCCPPCIETFENSPDEYMAKLPANMQATLKARQAKGGQDD